MEILKNRKQRIFGILSSDVFFYGFLALEMLMTYWLNSKNETMDGIYGYYQDYAIWIASGFDMDMAFSNGRFTFPMWGYGFLLAISQNKILILLFQGIVAFASLVFLDSTLKNHKLISDKGLLLNRLMILLGYSYFLLHTSLWPYSLSASFMLISMTSFLKYFKVRKYSVLAVSSLFFGLSLNLRSDYLYLAFSLFLLYFVLRFFNQNLSVNRRHLVFWLATILIALAPWALYTKYRTGSFLLSSTNGGHVLFVSLGQLPNNSWGIKPTDEDPTMWKIVRDTLGEHASSVDLPADRLLKGEWKKRVSENPKELLKKCAYNFYQISIRPFGVGEIYRKFLSSESEIEALKSSLKIDISTFDIKSLILKVFDKKYLGFFIPITINVIGIIVFLLFWIYFFRFLLNFNQYKDVWVSIIPLLCLVFYQIAILVLAFFHPNYNSNIFPIYGLLISYFSFPPDKQGKEAIDNSLE